MLTIKNLQVLNKGYVKLIDVLGDEKRIADIACISYGKEESSNSLRLLRILLKNGHYSPFEHVQFTFKIKAPIFIARQWMRHRTGKYNEQSRRYTKKNWEYYIPDLNRLSNLKTSGENIQKQIEIQMNNQIQDYENLIRSGVPPEVARSIMGTGFYTTFYFTIDLRNLLHFLKLRKDEHAQFEMQEYAKAIEEIIYPYIPNIMDYWRENNGFE